MMVVHRGNGQVLLKQIMLKRAIAPES
ncbi:hypothetical protein PCC21_025010 [Pectobacterium carotovorum subsp. carotovorum PCC21]|nr:hypothetical protein PCC21_025010 [Pectobacterium carotovorum subsp. carotovorum PCC21]